MNDDPDLKHSKSFRFWVEDKVRFSDLDALGHVNNNAYGVYFEQARVSFMIDCGMRGGPGDPAVVVRRIEIDYLRELYYPAKLRVGLSVLRIGNTSVRLGCGLFQAGVCHATSVATMVRIDRESRAAFPMTEAERKLLAPYLLIQA